MEERLELEDEVVDGDQLEFLINLCDDVVFEKIEGKAAIGMIKKTIYRQLLTKLWCAISNLKSFDLVFPEEKPGSTVGDGEILLIGDHVGLAKTGGSSWIHFLMDYQEDGYCPSMDKIPSDKQEYAYQKSVDFIRQRLA